jgi:hypothetical protein
MRLILLAFIALALGVPATAQQPPVSSSDAGKPSVSEDSGRRDLPVSLDRIREALRKTQDSGLLRNLDIKPDFTVKIEEQAHIDAIMSKLDFKSGPAPAGGLYGYEQQRRLFNPTDRPLQQPYAAFSGGEFVTIAIENLIRQYLGGKLLNAITDAERSRAEAAARQEVDQAIEEYCAARPDRYSIQLCTDPRQR